MKVEDIITGLKFGELRHFNFGESAEEGISEIHYPLLMNLINQGILDIYSKVPLQFKEIYIQPIEGKTIYKLHPRFAESNTESNEVKYIIDNEEDPFLGNIFRIVSVFSEIGCELPINDHSKCNSVFTTGLDTLQVPVPENENALSVIYQTCTDLIKENGDIEQYLDVPIVYKQALLMFIIGKAHLSRAHMDSEIKHSDYLQRYNAELERLKMAGYFISDATSCSRFNTRGFA